MGPLRADPDLLRRRIWVALFHDLFKSNRWKQRSNIELGVLPVHDCELAGSDHPYHAEQSRRHIIETCTDRDILLMSGHFPAPTVGRLVTVDGKPQFRFV
jgi:hypothetical protein